MAGATRRLHQLDNSKCSLKRPRHHSPQTFVKFQFRFRLHYMNANGTRWKIMEWVAYSPDLKRGFRTSGKALSQSATDHDQV